MVLQFDDAELAIIYVLGQPDLLPFILKDDFDLLVKVVDEVHTDSNIKYNKYSKAKRIFKDILQREKKDKSCLRENKLMGLIILEG